METVASGQNHDNTVAGAAWMTTLAAWSWGTTLTGVHIVRSGGRRDIARLAFGTCISIPILIFIGAGIIGAPEGSAPVDRPWTNLVWLLTQSDTSNRPLLLMAFVPASLTWTVLLRLPSIAWSDVHRATVNLGSAATSVAIVDVGLFSADRTTAAPAAVATAFILAVLAVRMTRTAAIADVRLPTPLDVLQRVAIPFAVAAGSAIAVVRATGWLSDSDSPTDPPAFWAISVAFLILLQPIAALTLLVHDFVLVGGRWTLRELLTPHASPTELRDVLRRRLGSAQVEVYFPDLDGRTLLDSTSRPVRLSPEVRSRLTPVGDPNDPIAWIDAAGSSTPPSQRSVVLGIAALALEHARGQARLLAVEEQAAARRRQLASEEGLRQNLEQTLHDLAQAPLVGAASLIERATAEGDERLARELLGEAVERIQSAQSAIRAVARGQFPHTLRVHGLDAAIEALADELPIVVVRDVPVGRLGDQQAELAVYRFVAECLTNTAKHADTMVATVEVALDEEGVVASVSDLGRGTAVLQPRSGLGAIADQIRLLGGAVELESRPGEGTTVRMSVPIAQPEVGLTHTTGEAATLPIEADVIELGATHEPVCPEAATTGPGTRGHDDRPTRRPPRR